MQVNHNENIRNDNTQDIFLRNATLLLIDLMNREVVIDLTRGGVREKHEIPFFYNFAGDEGFMKDFFYDLPTDCKYPRFAEGNYDTMPRGIITLSSFQMQPGEITNRFVRGSFNEETFNTDTQQKEMKAFSARLASLPISLSYDIKIESDNINKTFKIMEKIFDFYYRYKIRYFQFRGIRVPAILTFPDTASFQKNYNFTYSDANTVSVSLSITLETFFPSFDDYSKRYKGNTIKQFGVRAETDVNGSNLTDFWVDSDWPPKE